MNIIIIEDNSETLGVLRDFVRSINPSFQIQALTSGNVLLEQSGKVKADLLILGYDLGPSVTGTELLHYLEWNGRLSAKTHVAFISNTIQLAQRHAPLRFTQTYFYEKPISIAHLEEIFARMKENVAIFSSVFYLIDKQQWQGALNSLQMCKENCPVELQKQAWLLECMLLIKLGKYSRVIRRYQLIQDYDWAKVLRIKALASLAQVKHADHIFNTMASQDPYYSAGLALNNQLLVKSGSEDNGVLPQTLKEGEYSLFECEYRAFLLVSHGDWSRALTFLHTKRRRAKRGSHQAYFYTIAAAKALVLQLLRGGTAADSFTSALAQLYSYVEQLQHSSSIRDEELNNQLFPALLESLDAGKMEPDSESVLKLGAPTTDISPISLLLRIFTHWIKTGELFLAHFQQCIELIEAQGATSRATCNQILLEELTRFTVKDIRLGIRFNEALGKRFMQGGKYELAALYYTRALEHAPEQAKITKQLQACMLKLEVKQFFDHTQPIAEL